MNTVPGPNDEPQGIVRVGETWSPKLLLGDLPQRQNEQGSLARYQIHLDLSEYGIDQPITMYAESNLGSYVGGTMFQPFDLDHSYQLDVRDFSLDSRAAKMAEYDVLLPNEQGAARFSVFTDWVELQDHGLIAHDADRNLRMDPQLRRALASLRVAVSYPGSEIMPGGSLVSQPDHLMFTGPPPMANFCDWRPLESKPLPTAEDPYLGALSKPGYGLAIPFGHVGECSIFFKLDSDALQDELGRGEGAV